MILKFLQLTIISSINGIDVPLNKNRFLKLRLNVFSKSTIHRIMNKATRQVKDQEVKAQEGGEEAEGGQRESGHEQYEGAAECAE